MPVTVQTENQSRPDRQTDPQADQQQRQRVDPGRLTAVLLLRRAPATPAPVVVVVEFFAEHVVVRSGRRHYCYYNVLVRVGLLRGDKSINDVE